MAQLTYTVTVATGSLYLGGGATGSVYYLDGTRDIDLSWVKSGTLRFDQSDNTNDNHPLFFATQTSSPQSNVYSTGVSYYLDGAASQADYFNTSTFNAATTRYVEVTPASDTTFYYACYIHGIGMGGEIDITQNTWGALGWNTNSWGTIENDVNVTGIQLNSSISSVTAFPEFGWGGQVWNSSVGGWGNLKDTTVAVSGSQLQTNVGEEGIETETNRGWGRKTWNNNEGWGIAGTLEVGGIQLQTSTPSVSVTNEINVGWGRLEWGNGGWNVGYSVELGTLSLQSNIGEESAFTDFVVEQSGMQLQTTVSEAHESVADFIATPFGLQLQSSQGDAVGAQDVNPAPQGIGIQSSVGPVEVGALTLAEPSGTQLQSNVGEEDLAGGAIVSPTNIGSAFVLGTADAVSVAEGTGSQLQTSISGVQEINANATVDLTGIQLTATLQSINITPWNEVDLGVNNTWTEVDLAA